MAIFLEDTKKSVSFNLTAVSESIDRNCYELNESVTLSELAWQNLTIQCMKEEYISLKEADEEKGKAGIKNTVKNFFLKVIEWVKKQFTRLKEFVRDTVDKLSSMFGVVSKFAVDNRHVIMSGAELQPSVSIHRWKDNSDLSKGKDIPVLANVVAKLQAEGAKVSDAGDEIIDKLVTVNEREDVTVTTAMAKIAIENATDSNKTIQAIKKSIASIQKPLQDTDKAAKKGVSASDKGDESQISQAKQETEEGKKKVTKNTKLSSGIIRICNKVVSDSHRINMACVRAAKGKDKQGAKDMKKGTKELDKALKNK